MNVARTILFSSLLSAAYYIIQQALTPSLPLQVSPRKKFKCPLCTSEESLWSDPQHYLERNECINVFHSFFRSLPLQTVKFRLDPVLFKIDSPLNRYPDMGEL